MRENCNIAGLTPGLGSPPQLARSEPKPGLLEKAKARIDIAKVGFEGANLLVAAAPHLHTAWEHLRIHFGG